MLKLLISFVLVTTLVADYQSSDEPPPWWVTDAGYDNSDYQNKRVPFPQCLLTKSNSGYSGQSSFQKSFNKVNWNQESQSNYGYNQNSQYQNDDMLDYSGGYDRKDSNGPQVGPAVALKITGTMINGLGCDFNGADPQNLNKFLNTFKVPEQFCTYYDQLNCYGKTSYRTANGVCNNEQHPYQGSSHTAFDRLLPADYDDYLSKPRRKSVAGGLLPPCRRVSLALGHKPIFDRSFNNFFVIFGQVIGHDMSLSIPVTDTYSGSVSSCTCDSKSDWNKCNVIDVPADDPYMSGQKCMAFPATAQGFKDESCSLGVKEQLNGNTHCIDLSILYGSDLSIALALRGHRGKLKSTRFKWSQYESPPAQQAGKSCTDSTPDRSCFAGGDSRLMITSLFTGIQVIFLRFHNYLARTFAKLYPEWSSDLIYEESRRVNVAMFQLLTYDWWLPILFGYDGFAKYVGVTPIPSYYNENVPPVVFNEVAVAAMRCHTLVRDLFSRCTYDGKRIDQLWLVDIVHKSKPAYDVKNNGLDSILCGSFYDYGFAHDGHFASQIQNRLFESIGQYGQYWRNDLVAINICRGREHGIPPYNAYRGYCGINKAYSFEDFGDTINYDGVQLLKKLYKSPDDVDLFVGLNLEDQLPGAIIGPTSACLLGKQFQRLRDGDRLFYTNKDVFTPDQLAKIKAFPIYCFICLTVDIKRIPYNPFQPPNEYDNPLYDCSSCEAFDLTNWQPAENAEYAYDPAYQQYSDDPSGGPPPSFEGGPSSSFRAGAQQQTKGGPSSSFRAGAQQQTKGGPSSSFRAGAQQQTKGGPSSSFRAGAQQQTKGGPSSSFRAGAQQQTKGGPSSSFRAGAQQQTEGGPSSSFRAGAQQQTEGGPSSSFRAGAQQQTEGGPSSSFRAGAQQQTNGRSSQGSSPSDMASEKSLKVIQ